jgi:hypothetical protein
MWLVLLLPMGSLRKRPGSNKRVCCYTLPDGLRSQKSIGKEDQGEAMGICLAWEAVARRAREGSFTHQVKGVETRFSGAVNNFIASDWLAVGSNLSPA